MPDVSPSTSCRVPAEPGLADRVAFSIELAATQAGHPARAAHLRRRRRQRGGHRHAEQQRGPRSRKHLAAAVAVVVALLGGLLGWRFGHGGGPSDPPQIARVVAMLSTEAAGNAALRGGEQFDFGGQTLTVRSYEVEGILTLVATSSHPFPVPVRADLVAGSSATAWMATHGKLAMYGVNHPAGRGAESMFLVAGMPVAQLPQVAARLHLL